MDTIVNDLISQELKRQRSGIELIASENFTSQAVIDAMGSCLTNKYAEGYPGKRYYGGCEIVDKIEKLAIDRLCELFGAEYANVQPHSGAQANTAVFLAILNFNPGLTFAERRARICFLLINSSVANQEISKVQTQQ